MPQPSSAFSGTPSTWVLSYRFEVIGSVPASASDNRPAKSLGLRVAAIAALMGLPRLPRLPQPRYLRGRAMSIYCRECTTKGEIS